MTLGADTSAAALFGADWLRTAVLLSLFLDRRASDDDVLPGGDGDKRGWLGDELAAVEGDRIGSRLWLLDRAKRSDSTAALAKLYAEEALAWLVEDRVASSVEVATWIDGERLYMTVAITRPTGDQVAYQFAHAWDAVGFESLDAEVFA